MVKSYNINYWNEEAKKDVNFSSVISPEDKVGLKAEYVSTVNKKYIEGEILKLKEGAQILDFGCGVGRLSQWSIFNKYKYTGIDQSKNMIEVAKKYFGANKNLSFTSYSGHGLPFESNSFDCIIAIWVLQHILDDNYLQNLLNEFARILKENGKILLFEQITDVEKSEYLKNEIVYKKHRTLNRYIDLFGEKYVFVLSKKTDGLISHGLFYKSLNIFSRLHFYFLKYFIKWFIKLDELYYQLIIKLNILKPIWMDTFILITKKS